MSRSRLTPVGRLIIFILVFAPIAYFGASYITGQTYKDYVGGEKTETSNPKPTNSGSEIMDMKKILEEKDAIILEYQKQSQKQQKEIEALKAELEQLKKQ